MTRNQPPRIDAPAGPDSQLGAERQPGAAPQTGAPSSDGDGGTSAAANRAVPRSLRRLTCLSVTHRTHSTERIGGLAPADPVETAREITAADRVTEAMVLTTCNRVEVYVSTRTPAPADREAAIGTVSESLNFGAGTRQYTGLAVADHLARVAAGLESAILGEVEIAGQVSDALAAAKDEGLAGGVLGRVGNAALRAARTCRTETAIDDGPAGYGSAVCREIADALDCPPDRLLLIGAGDIARTVTTAVQRRWDARVDIANRSPAPDLPSADGSWWPLSALDDALEGVDAVVSATGADEPVLDCATVERAGIPERDEPLTVVDLGTPPDVSAAAGSHPGLAVSDIEDLAAVVREASDRRREAVAAAEAHIDEALDRLVACERENRAEDVIRALHTQAAAVREAELDRAKRRLAEGEADAETVLEDFASALSGRLLAAPTDELRTAARERDETALRAARRLFDLDGGEPE